MSTLPNIVVSGNPLDQLRRDARSNALAVLEQVQRFALDGRSTCCAAVARLAKGAGISHRTTQKWLRWLEKHGFILWMGRTVSRYRGTRRYSLARKPHPKQKPPKITKTPYVPKYNGECLPQPSLNSLPVKRQAGLIAACRVVEASTIWGCMVHKCNNALCSLALQGFDVLNFVLDLQERASNHARSGAYLTAAIISEPSCPNYGRHRRLAKKPPESPVMSTRNTKQDQGKAIVRMMREKLLTPEAIAREHVLRRSETPLSRFAREALTSLSPNEIEYNRCKMLGIPFEPVEDERVPEDMGDYPEVEAPAPVKDAPEKIAACLAEVQRLRDARQAHTRAQAAEDAGPSSDPGDDASTASTASPAPSCAA